MQTELDKARGLLKKCQDMFDKRNAELEELRKNHSEDHNQVVAHQKEIEAMKEWSEEAKGQMQGRRPASIVPRAAAAAARRPSRDAVAARWPKIYPRAELSQRAAQTPAHMSTLEAILARMTARPTEKDVQEAERLQKVMAGAD